MPPSPSWLDPLWSRYETAEVSWLEKNEEKKADHLLREHCEDMLAKRPPISAVEVLQRLLNSTKFLVFLTIHKNR
ncbi:hypothetical protein Tco_1055870 [Tanacetum coccineum]|uniref:Uncharacterized protein n=1 Tax=Tanacetum coccineum TaxID=301880 RepID=A0ABQ5H0W0_9ASTR